MEVSRATLGLAPIDRLGTPVRWTGVRTKGQVDRQVPAAFLNRLGPLGGEAGVEWLLQRLG